MENRQQPAVDTSDSELPVGDLELDAGEAEKVGGGDGTSTYNAASTTTSNLQKSLHDSNSATIAKV